SAFPVPVEGSGCVHQNLRSAVNIQAASGISVASTGIKHHVPAAANTYPVARRACDIETVKVDKGRIVDGNRAIDCGRLSPPCPQVESIHSIQRDVLVAGSGHND